MPHVSLIILSWVPILLRVWQLRSIPQWSRPNKAYILGHLIIPINAPVSLNIGINSTFFFFPLNFIALWGYRASQLDTYDVHKLLWLLFVLIVMTTCMIMYVCMYIWIYICNHRHLNLYIFILVSIYKFIKYVYVYEFFWNKKKFEIYNTYSVLFLIAVGKP